LGEKLLRLWCTEEKFVPFVPIERRSSNEVEEEPQGGINSEGSGHECFCEDPVLRFLALSLLLLPRIILVIKSNKLLKAHSRTSHSDSSREVTANGIEDTFNAKLDLSLIALP
jgi:hypothetical protein